MKKRFERFQIRRFVDAEHVDFAETHGLYGRFGAPGLPALWRKRVSGEIDTDEFLKQLDRGPQLF